MADSFIEAVQGISEEIRMPVWPTLLWCIKMLNKEKTIEEFATVAEEKYQVVMTAENKAKLQSYIASVTAHVVSDTTSLAPTLGAEMALKVAKAIWFTKVFPAILGLEFGLETESTLDSQFL